MNDPEICYLFVVIGMVQKNIIRKKFQKFSVGAKGGAFGVNVDGNLYTSTEDYSLDIRFGLTPAILKRPGVARAHLTRANIVKTLMDKPNYNELEIFGSINTINTVIGSSMGFTGGGNFL